MLRLTQLVEAINRAALAAADTVRAKSLQTIEDFFEPTAASGRQTGKTLDALDAALANLDEGEEADRLRELRERLCSEQDGGDGDGGASGDGAMPPGVDPPLRPKMVAITYPNESADGGEAHTVFVPLIALTPFSLPSLSTLTFKVDLEVSEGEDGELDVGFAPSGGAEPDAAHARTGSVASLEITLGASTPSQGLQKLIEGYERALRAQIPG